LILLKNNANICDKCRIIFKGSGLADSERKTYNLNPGFILAARMGNNHDIPEVY
jgi:hypothetical protein